MSLGRRARAWTIVADDMTGAADTAVGFAEHGWSARVLLAKPTSATAADFDADVLAISTAARAAADDDAALLTARAVTASAAATGTRLYLKIDSVGRGSVAGQVRGALSAWRERHPDAQAIVCPAYPALGRSVVDGAIRLDGGADADLAATRDPVSPRSRPQLTEIIAGAVRATLGELPGAATVVVDAASDADLDALADVILDAPDSVIAIGSGGLASAIARRSARRDPGTLRPVEPIPAAVDHVLVAVSSLHPTALEQTRRLREAAVSRDVTIVTAPEADGLSASAAAADFAARAVAALRTSPAQALILVGGDGAAVVLDQLGALSIDIDSSALPGCPQGTIRGGAADGLRVITKSGGFGAADTFVLLSHQLISPNPAPDHLASIARAQEEPQ